LKRERERIDYPDMLDPKYDEFDHE
jgi:hypothetical protein